MPKWQDDPELFLYIGNGETSVLHLWRCKRMSSCMPLSRGDFTDEVPVPGSRYLVRKGVQWAQTSLKELEDYLAPRYFLVNCQGLVYVELNKFSQGPETDGGEVQSKIYLRLHDVLNMEKYGLNGLKVPYREVEYLKHGNTAEVDPSPNEMKLSADLTTRTCELEALRLELNEERAAKETLEGRVIDLEGKVELLGNALTDMISGKGSNTNLPPDWECVKPPRPQGPSLDNDDLKQKFADLEAKIKTLIDNESKLITELSSRSEEIATLKEELEKNKKSGGDTGNSLDKRVQELEAELKRCKEREAKLTAELDTEKSGKREVEKKNAKLEAELEGSRGANVRETWMNDDKDRINWVAFKDLEPKFSTYGHKLTLRKSGTTIRNDGTTNVRASNIKLTYTDDGSLYPAVVIEVSKLNKSEKAKFDPDVWSVLEFGGTKYAAKMTI